MVILTGQETRFLSQCSRNFIGTAALFWQIAGRRLLRALGEARCSGFLAFRESPASPNAGLSLEFDTAQEPRHNPRVGQNLFAEVLMTELDNVSEVDLEGLRDFVVRNEVVSGGDE